jgi:organic radical activating enzyme
MFSHQQIGNLKQQEIQDILQSSDLLEIKKYMMDGRWHPACGQCQKNEEISGVSARTVRTLDSWSIEKIKQDVNWFEPQHLVINWSNLCNLSCTYCNADTSTAWQAVKKIPIDLVRNQHTDLIQLAKQHGHRVEGLTLGGGEPLLQKGLIDFLKCLNPDQVRVMITTNLSVDLKSNPIYQELKNWPTVEWQISFDNVDPLQFEYVRNGASWSQLDSNIQLMQQDNQLIKAHPAYSIYCAFDLMSYYKYCVDRKLSIFWCYLEYPWDLDVRRLARPLRQLAIDEIQKVVDTYSGQGDLAIDTLQQYQKKLVNNGDLIKIRTYRSDPFKYSLEIERELEKTLTFRQLWPNLSRNLDSHHYENKI